MTTTILPPRELAFVRDISKSAAVFFAFFMIERMYASRATAENELAHILRMDVRTVHKQCVYLSASGLVSGQGADRWMLTPAGRGTLFAEMPSHDERRLEETELLLSEGSAQNVLLEEEEEAKNVGIVYTSSSSSVLDLRKSTFCATTKQILQAASVLFEADVYLHKAILSCDPEYVLGWVAKAWCDREKLKSPASLIYNRLMNMVALPLMYEKNPTRGLPAEFLREIGMGEAAEKAEWRDNQPAVTFEIPQYEHTPLERNEDWRSIVQELPIIKGVAFTCVERVEVERDVMIVYVRNFGATDRAKEANELVGEIASRIYAEQTGNPSARVVFELEVM